MALGICDEGSNDVVLGCIFKRFTCLFSILIRLVAFQGGDNGIKKKQRMYIILMEILTFGLPLGRMLLLYNFGLQQHQIQAQQ